MQRPSMRSRLLTVGLVFAGASSIADAGHAEDLARAVYDLDEGSALGAGPAKEHSGIVKSRNWPDVYWMHNDSGDEPRIYPVRRSGEVVKSEREPKTPGVTIAGAINVDWEDITVDDRG